MCSFCNQNVITGKASALAVTDVREQVRQSGIIGTVRAENTQIAFFGGSFTAIDKGYMKALLMEAKLCVEEYNLAGIRISTRPDKIDAEVLAILKAYGVTAIELGAQSMDDAVLKANHRGHTAEDIVKASRLIKEAGFELGLQMMTGLYGDTDAKSLNTAEEIITLAPATVRIYPTIVLKNTHLHRLFAAGEYAPQSLDEAVSLCSKLILMFEDAGITVIRVGLHAEESLEADMITGPYHPAFRELCMSEIFYNTLFCELSALDNGGGKCYNISVNPKDISAAVGQKKSNLKRLGERGFEVRVIADKSIKRGDFKLEISVT